MTTTDTFRAKAESIIALTRQWQRGELSWSQFIYRCDVTDEGAQVLAHLHRTSGTQHITDIAFRAAAK